MTENDTLSILPYVTFLISTYNRREVLTQTLRELQTIDSRCGLVTETVVVDNASTDGTAEMVAEQFPAVILIEETINRGACAKNRALDNASGRYIVFLDDDSYPTADSIRNLIEHFEADPKLGAAVFDVILPDGSQECSAYPRVFIGCGTGFRREALLETGGLPRDFFMQAEEYDLSLRLLDAAWDIRRFSDLQVLHQKTPSSRVPTRTTRLDARNNLCVITRYFPRQWMLRFAVDWMCRYRWIAASKDWRHHLAFWQGVGEGVLRSLRPEHRRPVSLAVFEKFAMVREIRTRLEQTVRRNGYQSIVLVDVGKNILPFYAAAMACGVRVVAVADATLAKKGRKYRGVPVVDDAAALLTDFDAAFVANVSPVQASRRREQWRRLTNRPVVDLFETTVSVAKAA
jgi:GT2 family glycosyltransferase